MRTEISRITKYPSRGLPSINGVLSLGITGLASHQDRPAQTAKRERWCVMLEPGRSEALRYKSGMSWDAQVSMTASSAGGSARVVGQANRRPPLTG